MTGEPQQQQASARSGEFVDNVKQLLEHLYDLPFLQAHPLASHPVTRAASSGSTPSQVLRVMLMHAIETPKSASDRGTSAHGRYLKLVYLHYVDGMTIQEAAYSLGVSERQAYRDLQRGVEAVASALWETLDEPQAALDDAEPAPPMSVHDELERMMQHVSTVDFATLVAYAVHAVQKIAQQRRVNLTTELPEMPCSARTNEVVAQQLVVRVLSQIIQSLEAATVRVQIINNAWSVELSICLEGVGSDVSISSDAFTLQLFERLGWSYQWNAPGSGDATLMITVSTDLRFLLVIDDNESLGDLLDRYLMNMPYRIVSVTNPGEGLRLAQELLPDVIMLDIMMPDMDGWELLQRFRNSAKTAAIPIIVCSVFNDPELALSLGATLFLPKPLSRELFLDALQQLELLASDAPSNPSHP